MTKMQRTASKIIAKTLLVIVISIVSYNVMLQETMGVVNMLTMAVSPLLRMLLVQERLNY